MIEKFINSLTAPEERVISLDEAVCLVQQAHEQYIIGMTSGSFDMLHRGHLRYIHYLVKMTHDRARELNRIPLVVVAINSDASTRANKGFRTSNRPVFQEMQRAELVAGIWGVNLTFIFDHDGQLKRFHPQLFLVSTMSDHPPEDRPEIAYFQSRGVDVLVRGSMIGDTTTSILQKIQVNHIG